MMTANKGEWSEFYTFLRILADGGIYETDASLNRLERFMRVRECFGPGDEDERMEYKIHPDTGEVEIYSDGSICKVLPMETLDRYAEKIYGGICNGHGRAFAISGAEDILKETGCAKIKSPSDDKADLRMRTADDGKVMGYSVKSFLGKNPTLINASHATNFRYKVIGVDGQEAKRINAITGNAKIRRRVKAIKKCNGSLIFDGVCSPQFSANLKSIDPEMSRIISCMLLEYFSGEAKICSEIARSLENKNPLHFSYTGSYRDKIIKFLSIMEIGMMPSKPWNGEEKAKGGEIIIKKNGEVLVFRTRRTYEQNGFERYLLENTYLDTPSSSRWNFGSVYSDDEGEMQFNLNLQVRLK